MRSQPGDFRPDFGNGLIGWIGDIAQGSADHIASAMNIGPRSRADMPQYELTQRRRTVLPNALLRMGTETVALGKLACCRVLHLSIKIVVGLRRSGTRAYGLSAGHMKHQTDKCEHAEKKIIDVTGNLDRGPVGLGVSDHKAVTDLR